MRVLGVGVDIVSVDRVRNICRKYPDKFAQRILTTVELSEYEACRDKVGYLSKRFAAKEAVAKALGTGFSQALTFRDITVLHDAAGKPCVQLGTDTGTRRDASAQEVHVSISDEREYAVAYAIAIAR